MNRFTTFLAGLMLGSLALLGVPASAVDEPACTFPSQINCQTQVTMENTRRGDGLFTMRIDVPGGWISRSEYYWPFRNPTVNAHAQSGDTTRAWKYEPLETSSTQTTKVSRLEAQNERLRERVAKLRARLNRG